MDYGVSPALWTRNQAMSPTNKALQLTRHRAIQSESGSLLASTLGVSATVGGLCHAAEHPIR